MAGKRLKTANACAPQHFAESMFPEAEIIRSSRKTMAAQIKDRKLIVRAPLRASDKDVARFLQDHKRWIEKHLANAQTARQVAGNTAKLTVAELRSLAEQALSVSPQRAAYYAPLVGVTYGRITIRSQRSRWGSCSRQGNLNFNCLLMLAPREVLDSVVVHELCHRKEMNHSARFYAEVLRVFPDYRTQYRWLKENGNSLLAKLPVKNAE